MYGLYTNAFVFVIVVAFQTVLSEVSDKRKDRPDSDFTPLPINSKFWNPQLDDKTNMELIGIQYLDDSNKTVVEIGDKSAQQHNTRSGEANWNLMSGLRPGKRGERFIVWGLMNLMKPIALTGTPDNLKSQPEKRNLLTS